MGVHLGLCKGAPETEPNEKAQNSLLFPALCWTHSQQFKSMSKGNLGLFMEISYDFYSAYQENLSHNYKKFNLITFVGSNTALLHCLKMLPLD